MKLRIVKQNEDKYHVLFSDGTMVTKDDIIQLAPYVQQFKRPNQFKGGDERWQDEEYTEMQMYPGESIAYVTDTLQLLIDNPDIVLAFGDIKHKLIKKRDTKISKITKISDEDDMSLSAIQDYVKNKLVSVKQYASMQGRGEEQIKSYCRQGRIKGAFLVNDTYYLIPIDSALPEDNRRRTIIKPESKPDADIEYITTNEYCKNTGIGQQMLRLYLREGRISGAVHPEGSKIWLVPKDAPLPVDRRMTKKPK